MHKQAFRTRFSFVESMEFMNTQRIKITKNKKNKKIIIKRVIGRETHLI